MLEQKIREILNRNNYPKIGIISSKPNSYDIKKAKEIGLCCYLPKNIESHVLEEAFTKILHGEKFYPEVNSQPLKSQKLTNRQFEVLEYLAQGLSNKQIAYYMNVSEATVKLHINALLRAINATNRTQAVIKSQHLGII